MKTAILATIALILSTATALPFSLPAHEPNDWRCTGCDKAQQVDIKNDAGETLYSNNPSCPGGSTGGIAGGNLASLIGDGVPDGFGTGNSDAQTG